MLFHMLIPNIQIHIGGGKKNYLGSHGFSTSGSTCKESAAMCHHQESAQGSLMLPRHHSCYKKGVRSSGTEYRERHQSSLCWMELSDVRKMLQMLQSLLAAELA